MNLAEIYEASRTRAQRQRVIEDAIDGFSPDFMEAAELVAAIRASLRNKTENALGTDLEDAFQVLMDALKEADNTVQVTRYDDEWTDMTRTGE